MSGLGVSPTDLFNGIRAAETIIKALKDDGGSEEKVATAVTSIEHHLGAIRSLEDLLDTLPDDAVSCTTGTRERVKSLRQSEEARLGSLLERYEIPPTSSSTVKGKAKRVCRQLAWPYSGEKELAASSARLAASSDAVHLDAVVLTGKCTQEEVVKLERSVASRLDAIVTELQAQRSGYTDNAQKILDGIALSQLDMSTLVQNMQAALDERSSGRHQETSRALMPSLPTGSFRSPLLNEYINAHGATPLANTSMSVVGIQSWALPEQVIAPILLAALCCLTSRQRVENMLRNFGSLAKTDPASATLIVCIFIALSRMTVRLCRPLSLLGADHITFDDAFGALPLRLPFATCEYPGVFTKFMQHHFQTHPGRSFIVDGLYHLNLNNSRGQLVTNQTWGSFVKPNARVTMSVVWEMQDKKCLRCARTLFFHAPKDLFCEHCCQWYTIYADFSILGMDDADAETRRGSDNRAMAMNEIFKIVRNLHAFFSEPEFDVSETPKPKPKPRQGVKCFHHRIPRWALGVGDGIGIVVSVVMGDYRLQTTCIVHDVTLEDAERAE